MLKTKILRPGAIAPTRATSGSAGLDLYSAREVTAQPGEIVRVETGVAVAIPVGTYGRIAPRSSMGGKGWDVFAGVVDSDYRGEIVVLLFNAGRDPQQISIGDRIAQLIIEPYVICDADVVDELPGTERGEGGFGSTGK